MNLKALLTDGLTGGQMDRYGGWVKRSNNSGNKVGNPHHRTDQARQGSIGHNSRRNMEKRKLFT